MRVNNAQQEILLSWLEKNPELASGKYKVRHGRLGLEQRWTEISHKLNKHGSARDGDKWQRVWRDWKSNTRKKLNRLKTDVQASCGLTEHEQRVVALVGDECSAMQPEGDSSHMFVDIDVKGEPREISEDSATSAAEECDWELPSPVPAVAAATAIALDRAARPDPLRRKRKRHSSSNSNDTDHANNSDRRRLDLRQQELELERARVGTMEQLAQVLARLAAIAERLEARFLENQQFHRPA